MGASRRVARRPREDDRLLSRRRTALLVRVPFGNLARHTAAIRSELDAAGDRVLTSGRFLFGDELEAFETAFAAWCGASYAVGVASGTDAITIALQAVGVGRGDEVITVAN